LPAASRAAPRAVLDLAGLAGDAPNRSRLAALELGLDQAAEIPGDGRALRESHAKAVAHPMKATAA
jgi:hypothetical protein